MTLIKPAQQAKPILLRPGERRTILLVGDFITSSLALLTSLYFWARADEYLDLSWQFIQRTPSWFLLLPFIWMILMVELYDEHRAANWRETLRMLTASALVGLGFYLMLYFFYSTPKSLPRRGVAGFVMAAYFLTLVWRLGYIRIFTAPRFMSRVLLVGAGETGKRLLRVTKEIWPPPFFLVGIIDDDPEKIGTQIDGLQVFGGSDRLIPLIQEQTRI